MLVESHPQQSSTPPTPQLGLSQSMVSSPSPQNSYDMIERLKKRVGDYRLHHQISYEKNQNTSEAQTMKLKAETNRLTQQFLNNNQNNTTNSNKSKQQKSVNSSAQRNANKRTNSAANINNNSDPKCDSSPKPTKVAKVSNRNNNANKGSQSSPNNPTFRNNCAKFPPNSQSIQIDVKMKTSIDGSSIANTTTQPLMHTNPSINSITEIKREIEDNSYFQSVTVETIRDFLKDNSSTINGFPPNNFDFISADDIKDFICNDTNLIEDGFGPTNDGFGDEEFIKKFLEDINESTFNEMGNLGNQGNILLNTTTFKAQQPVVNHSNNMINGENNTNNGLNNCNNISINLLNNNININPNNNLIVNTNAMNSNNFITNSMQTPTNNEMTSYHPIQPRIQPNLMSNIPNRSSVHIMNPSSQPIAINHNTTIRYVNANTGTPQGQAPQLLLQQMPVMSQQSLNNAGMTSIQSQPTHHLIQQTSQPIHLRLPTSSVQRMVTVVPKTEDVSVQLSIQVPQQTTQLMPNTTSAQVQQSSAQSVAAAAKLKQMAQHVQQKSHQWVVNHSNPNLNQNTIQPINQQMAQQMRPQTNQTMVSTQRIAQPQQQQRQQVLSPDTQNANQSQIHQNQSQNYFTPQMNQQMYWQHNQHNQHHSQQTLQQQPPQQIQSQIQSQPQHQLQHQTQHQPQHQSQQPPHPSQQTPPQQLLQPIQQNLQQNQQNFANYWSHSSQMGQMSGQPSQPPQQQTQHYFNNNNNNNNNNYNYF